MQSQVGEMEVFETPDVDEDADPETAPQAYENFCRLMSTLRNRYLDRRASSPRKVTSWKSNQWLQRKPLKFLRAKLTPPLALVTRITLAAPTFDAPDQASRMRLA